MGGCCWHDWGVPPTGHWCIAPVYPDVHGSTRINMKQPCFWNLVNRMWQPVGPSYVPRYVDNVREHLTSPGQFYFDKSTSEIIYYPRPGQDMNKVKAILAVEETLVRHDGTINHRWDNVIFEYATWLGPMQPMGFVEQQTAACDQCPYGVKAGPNCGANDTYIVTPGNVVITGGRNIEFAGCTFQHLGAYAVQASNASQGVAWRA